MSAPFLLHFTTAGLDALDEYLAVDGSISIFADADPPTNYSVFGVAAQQNAGKLITIAPADLPKLLRYFVVLTVK